jgi:hypothetical protein
VRDSLVAALVAFADRPLRPEVWRFLQGLSYDELEFLAGFLGAWLIESRSTHGKMAGFQVPTEAGLARADQDHKMILLVEYLSRSEALGREAAVPAAGGYLGPTVPSTRLPEARA